MDQLQDIIDVDVIFLQYDPRRESLPRLIKLIDIRIVGFNSFENTIVDARFNPSTQGKFVCGRHNWYVRKLKQHMASMRVGQLCIRHWTMKSGDLASFKFREKVYPDVTYMFDKKSEYWFIGRVDGVDQRGFEQLFMEEWSRPLKRAPPIKEVLDDIQDQQIEMRLAQAATENNTEPGLDPVLLHDIINEFSMSRAQSPVNLESSAVQRYAVEKKNPSKRIVAYEYDSTKKMRDNQNHENAKQISKNNKSSQNFGKRWRTGQRENWRTEDRGEGFITQPAKEQAKVTKAAAETSLKTWRDEPRKSFTGKETRNKNLIFKNFNTKPSKFNKTAKKHGN